MCSYTSKFTFSYHLKKALSDWHTTLICISKIESLYTNMCDFTLKIPLFIYHSIIYRNNALYIFMCVLVCVWLYIYIYIYIYWWIYITVHTHTHTHTHTLVYWWILFPTHTHTLSVFVWLEALFLSLSFSFSLSHSLPHLSLSLSLSPSPVIYWQSPCDGVVDVLDCSIVVSNF